jgi:hypothetical protein
MPPPSPTPPRVSHLLPLHELAEQLAPSNAQAVNRLPDEVLEEVKSGLAQARLQQPICDSVWRHLVAARPRITGPDLLEKMAKAMSNKGGPRPRAATGLEIEKMNTLFAFIDVNVGRASETARAALESEAGRAMLQKSIDVAARYLANRLLSSAQLKEKPA